MKLIQSQHGSHDKMKFSNKYKSNCFRNKISTFCVFVFHNNYKNFFKFIYILLVFTSISLLCGANGIERTTMCPNCELNVTAMRHYAMLNIRTKILDALGYTNGTPESKGRDRRIILPLLTKFMEMYNVNDSQTNSLQNTKDVEEIPKIQRQEELITGEIIPLEHRHNHRHQGLPHNSTPFKFNLANFSSQDIKTAAVLLHVNNYENCQQNVNVSIYQLYEGQSRNFKYKFIKTIESTPDSMSWIQIDITPDLKNFQLLSENKSDTTMAVMLTYVSLPQIPSCPDLSSDKAIQYVLLKVQYDDKPKKRPKRTPVRQDCTDNQKYSECCRYPLEVDFDEMKWDFIITPRKYNAYYCLGDCPLGYNQQDAHAYLVQQMKTNVGPCCSPKKLNSISMLYFTHRGTILYAKVSGMVVESCGCA